MLGPGPYVIAGAAWAPRGSLQGGKTTLRHATRRDALDVETATEAGQALPPCPDAPSAGPGPPRAPDSQWRPPAGRAALPLADTLGEGRCVAGGGGVAGVALRRPGTSRPAPRPLPLPPRCTAAPRHRVLYDVNGSRRRGETRISLSASSRVIFHGRRAALFLIRDEGARPPAAGRRLDTHGRKSRRRPEFAPRRGVPWACHGGATAWPRHGEPGATWGWAPRGQPARGLLC